MGFLLRIVITTLAILLAVTVIPGIEAGGILSVLGAGLVLGLINAVVRPILLVLTLPLTLVTLGFFLLLLNAFCLWITSLLVKGFVVQGFWPAFFGALVVSVVSWLLTAFLSDQGEVIVITERASPRPPPRRIN